tara:strand:+ start:844 stop:1113 length:270 start_codon:yes stop_codon:yes gene_type:complete
MQENQDHIQIFKPNLIPVDQRDGWFRDPDSHAIVNCNKSQYEQYMASYKKREKKEQSFNTLQNDVDALKSDISDMKSMLLQLVEKKNAS